MGFLSRINWKGVIVGIIGILIMILIISVCAEGAKWAAEFSPDKDNPYFKVYMLAYFLGLAWVSLKFFAWLMDRTIKPFTKKTPIHEQSGFVTVSFDEAMRLLGHISTEVANKKEQISVLEDEIKQNENLKNLGPQAAKALASIVDDIVQREGKKNNRFAALLGFVLFLAGMAASYWLSHLS